MVANAHNDPGEDGLKMFNFGYLAGISGILLAWNGALLAKTLISDDLIAFTFTASCLENQVPISMPFNSIPIQTIPIPFYNNSIGMPLSFLCVVSSVLITIRTKSYLAKLQDRHLKNLPSRNALTYLDTLILFLIFALSYILKVIGSIFLKLDIWSFDSFLLVNSIMTVVVDDIVICFVFPIYIIMKTKRYLPKLWDSSRPIVPGNNDFYSENPSTVGILPQPRNDQVAESSI